jgi:hypothetical protein
MQNPDHNSQVCSECHVCPAFIRGTEGKGCFRGPIDATFCLHKQGIWVISGHVRFFLFFYLSRSTPISHIRKRRMKFVTRFYYIN